MRLSVPSWQEDGEGRTATKSSGTVAGGATVIAFSGYQGKSFAVLHLVTPRCELDREFGTDGTARITVPSSLRPPHPSVPGYGLRGGLLINVVAARNGGGAILAGNYEGEWVVGEVTQRGTLDTSFGDDGWASLPFPAGVEAILQEPSGRIIVAGGDGGGGCCTTNWAAALSAHGQFEDHFGAHGLVKLPSGADPIVDSLALLPNGDILAQVSHAHMGCAGHPLAALTPSGQPVPMFATRLDRFWQALGFGAFVGDAYVDGDGFTLVGTGEEACAEGEASSALSATGLIARFLSDGRVAAPVVRFPSPLYGRAWAFPDGHDSVLVASPWGDPAQLSLVALRPDGSADPRFASHGRAQVRTSARGNPNEEPERVSVTEANPTELVFLATQSGGAQLQFIRLHL
jgi:hypothetical protein